MRVARPDLLDLHAAAEHHRAGHTKSQRTVAEQEEFRNFRDDPETATADS